MSGLVGYGSSDESGDEETRPIEVAKKAKVDTTPEPPKQSAEVPIASNIKHETATTSARTDVEDAPIAGPAAMSANDQTGGSASPFSAERASIMELTMPPVPVFDIPESPPGSPDTSLEMKLEQFARLKKQGHHFNERLAKSNAINNPNLFNKLMRSFGIESEQYDTSISKDVWDPKQFPDWAYKDSLARAQAVAQKKRKEAQAEAGKPEFVSATKQ